MTTEATASTSLPAAAANCSDAAAAWDAQLDGQLYAARMVDRSVTPVWYAVGIVGNVLSAVVWLQRRMRRNNSSAVYLGTLSVNDTLFLLLHVLLDLYAAWQVLVRAFQFGQKKSFRFNSILATESIFFYSIRFGNLINLPLVH